ncbi:hypothetical protein LCGC14_2461310 [marine sediment metagenome]|uniref:Uncharacterized protein n=1 Tax=marine sediment metagenome TaxID=412755 RepID=A0A0F9BDT7_9ZZZZ
MEQPTHYTSVEGGAWRKWPSWVEFDQNVLAMRNSKRIVVSPHNGRTPSEPLYVHSLVFDDPTKGFDKVPRWDCINGWTHEL